MHSWEGIILIYLERPYVGSSRREIRDHIVNKQAKIHVKEFPSDWSVNALDLINKTLIRKPSLRLGTESPGILKKHQWFNDFDWEKLEDKTMKSPFEGIVIILFLILTNLESG